MANTFTRKLSRSVGTSATEIGSYTVGASTTTVVVGLSVTNRTGSAITANVFIQDVGAANTYIVVNAPISSGSSLVVGGGDQKLVLITGDKVFVQSSASSSLDAVMSIMEITSVELKEKINNGEKLIVEFWAEWCGPCRMMKPIFERISNENTSDVKMYTMNVDLNREVGASLGIRSIPTIKVINSGEVIDTKVGVLNEGQLKDMLTELING